MGSDGLMGQPPVWVGGGWDGLPGGLGDNFGTGCGGVCCHPGGLGPQLWGVPTKNWPRCRPRRPPLGPGGQPPVWVGGGRGGLPGGLGNKFGTGCGGVCCHPGGLGPWLWVGFSKNPPRCRPRRPLLGQGGQLPVWVGGGWGGLPGGLGDKFGTGCGGVCCPPGGLGFFGGAPSGGPRALAAGWVPPPRGGGGILAWACLKIWALHALQRHLGVGVVGPKPPRWQQTPPPCPPLPTT